MDVVEQIENDLRGLHHRLRKLAFFVYALRLSPLAFFVRKRLMALSDDINALTTVVEQIGVQYPPEVTAALSTAAASGDDPAAPAAVSSLSSALSTTVSQMALVLPSASVSNSLSAVASTSQTGVSSSLSPITG